MAAKYKETPTDDLIYLLRLMGEVGGNLTRDRKKVVIEAADRLESLDERIAIMTEYGEPGRNDND